MNVNLREEREVIQDGIKYKLIMGSAVPKNVELQFPNTECRDERSLQTKKYGALSKLDHDIQKRISKSKIVSEHVRKKTLQGLILAVACNQLTYNIYGVLPEHNYYLYQIDVFRTLNDHGDANPPAFDLPALFELDGRGTLLNIVVFHTDTSLVVEPLSLPKLRCIIIPTVPLFTCERVSEQREEKVCAVSLTPKEDEFVMMTSHNNNNNPVGDLSYEISENKEDGPVQHQIDLLIIKD